MRDVMASRPKQAEPRPQPRLYLITPALVDAAAFAPRLEAALQAGDVAAVLLRLASADERTLINRVKQLASVCQQHDAALVLDGRAELVARGGADGAHLTGISTFTDALDTLKPDRIAGCGGLDTRHDAMLAAEQDADYVMFGEPDAQGRRPAFELIEERIGWWSELLEIPCVAYAAGIEEIGPLVAAGADFVAPGDWVWADAAGQVREAARRLALPETAA
jgi:thiamine-phosphate pyrophosphorylase